MPKRLICLILTLMIVLLASSCTLPFKVTPSDEVPGEAEEGEAEQTQASMRKTVIYYVDDQNLLVPVTCTIPWVEGIAREALEHLVTTPERSQDLSSLGLRPSLPDGTKVLGLAIRDGRARVDFSKEFLSSTDVTAEKNALHAVIYTLTEFPTVNDVEIQIEGKTVSQGSQGTQLSGIHTREKINLEANGLETTDGAVPTTLYFRNRGEGSLFTPTTRMVEPSGNMIKSALEELIKGPADKMGLMPVLPAQTQVLGVQLKGSEVVVDFSKDIEYYGGGMELEQALIDSVVLTVSEFDGVEKVSILVEGEAVVLPEGTSLDVPILKPSYINPSNL